MNWCFSFVKKIDNMLEVKKTGVRSQIFLRESRVSANKSAYAACTAASIWGLAFQGSSASSFSTLSAAAICFNTYWI